jgi:hypothetical protein
MAIASSVWYFMTNGQETANWWSAIKKPAISSGKCVVCATNGQAKWQ